MKEKPSLSCIRFILIYNKKLVALYIHLHFKKILFFPITQIKLLITVEQIFYSMVLTPKGVTMISYNEISKTM